MTDPLLAVRRPTVGIGMITPSANIVVERVTTAILSDFPMVSAHFSRTEVVGSSDAYPDDYDWTSMLRAAELLGHARPASICWNGSKGGSIGFAADRKLCARIREATGIAATTSTLAIDTALRITEAKRVALVTPYQSYYAAKLPPVFAEAGYTIVAEAHAGVGDNLAYAAISDADIVSMIRSVSAVRPDAIIAYCTNFPVAHLVDFLEREMNVPLYDSVSAGVWAALRVADQATAIGRRWGGLFGLSSATNYS